MSDLDLLADLVPIRQQAKLKAMALRGEEPQVMAREADALSGVASALAGLGGRSVRAMSQDMGQRGDALRALASSAQGRQDQMAYEDKRETRRRGEHLSDVASQRSWQEERDILERANALEAARLAAGQKQDEKKTANVNQDVEALSKRSEALPTLRNDLATLIHYSSKDDIPGVGQIDGNWPEALTFDEDAIRTRQAAKGVLGAILKEQSGITVGEKELERKLDELGMRKGGSEKEYRLGIKRLVENATDFARSREAAYMPEAVGEARRRGMVTSADLPKAEGGAFDGGGPPKVATEAEYNALPAGAEYVAPNGKLKRKK